MLHARRPAPPLRRSEIPRRKKRSPTSSPTAPLPDPRDLEEDVSLDLVELDAWEIPLESEEDEPERPSRAHANVTLVQAQNVPRYDLLRLNPLEPFCRVALRGTDQVFKTRVMTDDVNPRWDETFEFEFDDRTKVLEITLYDQNVADEDIEIAGLQIRLVKKEGVVQHVTAMTPVEGHKGTAGTEERGLPAPSLHFKVAITLEFLG
jgi:hypothetical protein